MGGEPRVHVGPVGIDKFEEAAILPQDLLEEVPGLARHRPEQGSVEVAVKIRIGDGGVHLAEVEPLAGEVFDESFHSRGVEEAVGLPSQALVPENRAVVGGGEQFPVGRTAMEEVGKPVREGVGVERGRGEGAASIRGRGRTRFAEEEEMGGCQDRAIAEGERFLEAVARLEFSMDEGNVVALQILRNRPAEGPGKEIAEEALAFLARLGADGLERIVDPSVDVAAPG